MNARVHDFGIFTLVNRMPDPNGEMRRGLFRCFCGNEFETYVSNIRTGHTKSCGCTAKERTSEAGKLRTKHGHSRGGGGRPMGRTGTYKSWQAMIARCTYEKHPAYDRYGGRGITICKEWFDFSMFLTDMGIRPDGLTLDRIDPDGNYERGNCRWTTWQVQRANQTLTAKRRVKSQPRSIVGAGI